MTHYGSGENGASVSNAFRFLFHVKSSRYKLDQNLNVKICSGNCCLKQIAKSFNKTVQSTFGRVKKFPLFPVINESETMGCCLIVGKIHKF